MGLHEGRQAADGRSRHIEWHNEILQYTVRQRERADEESVRDQWAGSSLMTGPAAKKLCFFLLRWPATESEMRAEAASTGRARGGAGEGGGRES